MSNSQHQIAGMTLAITNMEQMVAFYTKVFGLQFQEQEMYGSRLYATEWGGLKVLFCPADLAQNTATQNRHQLDVLVTDLRKALNAVTENDGSAMGEITETDTEWSVGIYDPDKNSLVLKQMKHDS